MYSSLDQKETPLSWKQCRWYILQTLASLGWLCILHTKITTWLGIKVLDHKYFSLKILATAPPSDTENPGPAKQHFLSREPLGLSSEAFFCLDSARIFFYFNLEIQKCCQKMYGQSLFPFILLQTWTFQYTQVFFLLRKMLFNHILIIVLASPELPTLSGWNLPIVSGLSQHRNIVVYSASQEPSPLCSPQHCS